MSDTAFTLAPRSLPRSRPRFRLMGISGSAWRPSRTTSLVETLAAEVTRQCPVQFELHDLAGMGAGIGAFSREALPPAAEVALKAIEAADALIVGTPIYNGSYTGLFKHLFDFLSPDGAAGKTCRSDGNRGRSPACARA